MASLYSRINYYKNNPTNPTNQIIKINNKLIQKNRTSKPRNMSRGISKNNTRTKKRTKRYKFNTNKDKLGKGYHKKQLKQNNNGPFIITDPYRTNLGPDPVLLYVEPPVNGNISYEEYINMAIREMELQKILQNEGLTPKINTNFANIEQISNQLNNNQKPLVYFTERMYPFSTLKEINYDFTLLKKIYDNFLYKVRELAKIGYINIDMKEDNLMLNYDEKQQLTNVYFIDTDPDFFINIKAQKDKKMLDSICFASLVFLMFSSLDSDNILSIITEKNEVLKKKKKDYLKNYLKKINLLDDYNYSNSLTDVNELILKQTYEFNLFDFYDMYILLGKYERNNIYTKLKICAQIIKINIRNKRKNQSYNPYKEPKYIELMNIVNADEDLKNADLEEKINKIIDMFINLSSNNKNQKEFYQELKEIKKIEIKIKMQQIIRIEGGFIE